MTKRRGFTLIELLVVIAIIGLLSTLAVVALNSARQRSRDAKRVADIRQIQTALELGFSEVQVYPTAASAVPLGVSASSTLVLCNNAGVPVLQANQTGCTANGIYMGLVPANPTPNGAAYMYTSANGSTYSITFTLEGTTGQLATGANCANPNGIQAGSSC
jgi:general secretion pathway protein G